ncbi:MAG: hypothetical protein Q8Q18_01435 [bacterium]|nr:hypothetical protein [bacterium]
MARTPTCFSLEILDEITAEALIGDGIKKAPTIKVRGFWRFYQAANNLLTST